MFRLARLATLAGWGLASSSFLGLLARHIPPIGIMLCIVALLLLATIGLCLLAGNLIDHHLGWNQDSSLAMAIGALALLILGGAIGWLLPH